MTQPFKCPHCGTNDYVITLTGCTITGATVQEAFEWDSAAGEYGSSGSIIVESEEVENEGGQAVCAQCEKDVSEAVAEYEEAQGNGTEEA